MKYIEELKSQIMARVQEMNWGIYEKSSDIVLHDPRRVIFNEYYVSIDKPWLDRYCPDVVREITFEGEITYLLRVADVEEDFTIEIKLREAEYLELANDIRAVISGVGKMARETAIAIKVATGKQQQLREATYAENMRRQ